MWKAQHMDGAREINELHVPIGRPVRLIMGSEDVIHSFFIPDFRVKADVVPGRYNHMWFTATQPGRFHIFCTQYCGTKHSAMIGWVTAMTPADYQTWLSGGSTGGSMSEAGAKLFTDLACVTCHMDNAQGRGPSLKGVFGSQVTLASGQKVIADEAYVRESILTPTAKMVNGYPPLMPTFQGVVSEEQIAQLTAYVKSLATAPAAPGAATPAPAPAGAPAATPQGAAH
jgi:cytochrome c oxidase subunit 2